MKSFIWLVGRVGISGFLPRKCQGCQTRSLGPSAPKPTLGFMVWRTPAPILTRCAVKRNNTLLFMGFWENPGTSKITSVIHHKLKPILFILYHDNNNRINEASPHPSFIFWSGLLLRWTKTYIYFPKIIPDNQTLKHVQYQIVIFVTDTRRTTSQKPVHVYRSGRTAEYHPKHHCHPNKRGACLKLSSLVVMVPPSTCPLSTRLPGNQFRVHVLIGAVTRVRRV